MKGNEKIKILFSLFYVLSFIGCAEQDDFSSEDSNFISDEVTVEPVVWNSFPSGTRGLYIKADNIEQFAMHGFYNKTKRLNNSIVRKKIAADGTVTWKGSKALSFPGTGAMNFVGLSPSFDVVKNSVFTYNDWHFDYKLSTHNWDPANNNCQQDLLYGSMLNATRASTGGSVKLPLKHLLSYQIFIGCINDPDVNVEITKLTIHNLIDGGSFTYNTTKALTGNWTLGASYDNYTLELPAPLSLVYNQVKSISNDSVLMVMPKQNPTKWKTKKGAPVTILAADAATPKPQCYLEVECHITYKGHDIIGGTSDKGNCAYFPFGGRTWAMGSTYSNRLDFPGGYYADGTPIDYTVDGDEPDGLNSENLYYEIQVEEWVEEEPTEIKVK